MDKEKIKDMIDKFFELEEDMDIPICDEDPTYNNLERLMEIQMQQLTVLNKNIETTNVILGEISTSLNKE